jgi:threonine aldolase
MAIDLRSDTVTKPSAAMREAIASAPVGDDVYSDDPTVNSLEERVAALFGKEAGVFTPTGSLANQLAIRMLVAPGEELIAETNSHIVRAELGAAAVFSGITTRTFPAKNGLLKVSDALEIARPIAGHTLFLQLQLPLKTHIILVVELCNQSQKLPPFAKALMNLD